MREIRTSGSVGAPGGKPPGATRHPAKRGRFSEHARPLQSDISNVTRDARAVIARNSEHASLSMSVRATNARAREAT